MKTDFSLPVTMLMSYSFRIFGTVGGGVPISFDIQVIGILHLSELNKKKKPRRRYNMTLYTFWRENDNR